MRHMILTTVAAVTILTAGMFNSAHAVVIQAEPNPQDPTVPLNENWDATTTRAPECAAPVTAVIAPNDCAPVDACYGGGCQQGGWQQDACYQGGCGGYYPDHCCYDHGRRWGRGCRERRVRHCGRVHRRCGRIVYAQSCGGCY